MTGAVSTLKRLLLPLGAVLTEGIELAHMISVKAGGLDNSQNISGQATFYATLTMVSCFVFISGFMSLALLESWMVINWRSIGIDWQVSPEKFHHPKICPIFRGSSMRTRCTTQNPKFMMLPV